jgi:hypothetical protein
MTTPRDILLAAFGFSTKNRPADVAAKADELMAVQMRAMKGLYLFAARINPEFFADSSAINFTAGAPGYWLRPAAALSIWRIEDVASTEVIVVPRSQRTADVGRPALWRLGQKYYSAGNALDPVGGALTFFYSARPVTPATVDTAFDALWPTDFDPLLVLETAMYLAIQDGRVDEAASIAASRDKWAALFATFLEVEQVNVVYQYGNSRNYNLPELIQSVLASVPGGVAT